MDTDTHALTIVEHAALTAQEIKGQVQRIQEVMSAVMQEGQHYGIIPGTDKPTLYKAGAEKLALTFRLAPRFSWTEKDLGNGHREITMRCILEHVLTKDFCGEGVGSCSTMESKYRYRRGEPEDTGKPVPKEYWDHWKTNPAKAQQIIGGKGFATTKIDGQWRIVTRSAERVENPDIADVYNTVLKMSKKRALIDAILTVTAASDIFTQDMEDFAETPSSTPTKTTTHTPREAAASLRHGWIAGLQPHDKDQGKPGQIHIQSGIDLVKLYFWETPPALKAVPVEQWTTNLMKRKVAFSSTSKEKDGKVYLYVETLEIEGNAPPPSDPKPDGNGSHETKEENHKPPDTPAQSESKPQMEDDARD